MKPKSVKGSTLYLYKKLAENIEWGLRDRNTELDDFNDGRGGFIGSIIFVERHIETELSGANAATATNLVKQCRELLASVMEQGWSAELIESANQLTNKLKEQSWHEEG